MKQVIEPEVLNSFSINHVLTMLMEETTIISAYVFRNLRSILISLEKEPIHSAAREKIVKFYSELRKLEKMGLRIFDSSDKFELFPLIEDLDESLGNFMLLVHSLSPKHVLLMVVSDDQILTSKMPFLMNVSKSLHEMLKRYEKSLRGGHA